MKHHAMEANRPGSPIVMRNIAHRGLWDETIPQNTIEAFRRAWSAGATWIETDFHRTKAGQMVCLHAEAELRSYTGCGSPIADLSPADVSTLRLVPSGSPGNGFRIPLLEDVLATVPPHGTVQAEIKGYAPDYADRFDAAVRAAGLTEANIVVSSFQFDALADFHRRLPAYRTLWLIAPPKGVRFQAADWIARCREGGFDELCPGVGPWGGEPLTPSDAEAVRAAGLGFRLWGVNSPAALRYARDLGAAGFTCNFWHQAFQWARDLGGIELLP